MAILHRFGSADDFDPSKMLARELAYVNTSNSNYKAGLYLCYGPGDVRRQTTEQDIMNILNATPEAYSALQQLIADLASNPNELASILSDISALQTSTSGKIDKTSIGQTDTINDTTKVASTAITYAHGQSIAAINNNSALKAQTLISTNFPNIAVSKDYNVMALNVVGYPKTALVAGTSYTIGTLNADMRPRQTIVKHFKINQTVNAFLQINLGVVSIVVYSDMTTANGLYIAETFI